MSYPTLSIVGAGPGDPELITLKGLLRLQNADVILYDALIDQRLLAHAPISCIKIYVGKRANKHSLSQQQINELIVHYCKVHKHVVRLKGGDPFVFGRGHEELSVAKSSKISVEVIPGVSSCIAAPSSLNIPLTKRNICRSFWVMTATTSADTLSGDIALACQSSATMVILMGVNKINSIVDICLLTLSPTTPIAIIWNATHQESLELVCTLADIKEKMDSPAYKRIDHPGIIIIGEVIKVAYPNRFEEISSMVSFQMHKMAI